MSNQRDIEKLLKNIRELEGQAGLSHDQKNEIKALKNKVRELQENATTTNPHDGIQQDQVKTSLSNNNQNQSNDINNSWNKLTEIELNDKIYGIKDNQGKYSIDSGKTVSETRFIRSLTTCLEPLLAALHWQGKKHHLLEAFPYMSGISTINDFIYIMKNLYFDVVSFEISLDKLGPVAVPCLFVTKKNEVFVLLERKNNHLEVYDGQSEQRSLIPLSLEMGTAYFFKYVPEKEKLTPKIKGSYFLAMLNKYVKTFIIGVIVAFVLSVMYLAIPLFIRSVYNQIIPTESLFMLSGFLFALLTIILGAALLNWLQTQMIILAGSKISNSINDDIFKRLLYLAPAYTENATVNAQVARIKDFDNVREFLTGPTFRLFFDLTFIVVGLGVIWLLGGYIVIVIITSIIIYMILFLSLKGIVQNRIELSAQAENIRQDFLLESLYNLRTLKFCHAEETWVDRFRSISADASIKNSEASYLTSSINVVLDILMISTGFVIISVGALYVMHKSLSAGSLIAIMIIAWRMIYPIKGLFGSQIKIQQFLASVRQINSFMNILPERDPAVLIDKLKNIHGNVSFNRVSFRYPGAPDFALTGITFNVKQGEIVSIVGRIGSGKSTILKLILSLYQPQAGNIFLDEIDMRQLDPARIRYSIGYVSQVNTVFYGTIAQNIMLSNPEASENELYFSAKRADLWDDIMELPQGFQTRIDDQSHINLSPGFIQRLALARTYLRKPPIILLDEPATALDVKGENAYLHAIEYFRGHATIFIVTHRPSHLKNSDKILVMSHGQLILSGPKDQVMPKLPKELI